MGDARFKHPSSDPPPLVHLAPGYRLDRYELLAPYAAGGMASIWLGRFRGKHDFERLVAVKTMLPEYAADVDFRKMLIDESRVAARVRHTNVAEVLDVGDENGLLYIVMEWVSGDSLQTLCRTLTKRGDKLPLPIALRLAADASRGLHAAHELRDKNGERLGVVHRDVSPQNILVDEDGVAKLIDFGVAKARERIVGQTSSGLIKGKARYMPPEQALGKAVDRRTDVWAMGAVLQFLLSGRTPYSGANDLATLHKIASGEPPEPLPADVPAAVASVVSRALAPEMTARYATAEDLSTALEEALQRLGTPTSVSDVTKFLNASLPALAERRRKAVELALSAAEDRERMNVRLQPVLADGSSASRKSRVAAPLPPEKPAAPPRPLPQDSSVVDGVRPHPSAAPTALLGRQAAPIEDGASSASLESSIAMRPRSKRAPLVLVISVAAAAATVPVVLLLLRPGAHDAGEPRAAAASAAAASTASIRTETPPSSPPPPSTVASAPPAASSAATSAVSADAKAPGRAPPPPKAVPTTTTPPKPTSPRPSGPPTLW